MPYGKDGKRKTSYGYPMMEDDPSALKFKGKKPPAKKPPAKAKPKAYSTAKGSEVTTANRRKSFNSKIPFEGASGYSVGAKKNTQAGGPSKAAAAKAGAPGRKTYTDVAGF